MEQDTVTGSLFKENDEPVMTSAFGLYLFYWAVAIDG